MQIETLEAFAHRVCFFAFMSRFKYYDMAMSVNNRNPRAVVSLHLELGHFSAHKRVLTNPASRDVTIFSRSGKFCFPSTTTVSIEIFSLLNISTTDRRNC